MRSISLVLLSSACAATVTFTEAVGRLPVTRPELALTARDTIIALAIREAVLSGIPGFLPQRQVVVQRVPDIVSSHALPRIDSVAFFVLDTAQLTNVAVQGGNFAYLRPYPPRISGESAVVSLASKLALKAMPRGTHFLDGGSCSWRAVRQSGTWVVDTVLGCIIW